jgi:hypothetical protein
MWLWFIWLRLWFNGGYCEHGNGPLEVHKGWRNFWVALLYGVRRNAFEVCVKSATLTCSELISCNVYSLLSDHRNDWLRTCKRSNRNNFARLKKWHCEATVVLDQLRTAGGTGGGPLRARCSLIYDWSDFRQDIGKLVSFHHALSTKH